MVHGNASEKDNMKQPTKYLIIGAAVLVAAYFYLNRTSQPAQAGESDLLGGGGGFGAPSPLSAPTSSAVPSVASIGQSTGSSPNLPFGANRPNKRPNNKAVITERKKLNPNNRRARRQNRMKR